MNIPLLISHIIEFLSNKNSKYPVHSQLQDYQRQRKYLGSRDRRLISDIIYDVERNRLRYEWISRRESVSESDLVSAAVILSCKIRHPELMNDIVFRQTDTVSQLWTQLNNTALPEPVPDSIRWSLPEWILKKWQSEYGEKTAAAIAEKMLEEASLHVRVNSHLSQKFQPESDWKPGTVAPNAFRLDQRRNIQQDERYKTGIIEIQDEGSQLIGFAVNPQSRETIVDLCAGAGGKTVHLASQMNNRGQVIATDIASRRIVELAQRLNRNQLKNVQILTYGEVQKRFAGRTDAVLIDAPCSGSGVFRRHPDAKWRLDEHQLPALIRAQRDVLTDGQALVKPGGRLIYATCSLFAEENEGQAQWFLDKYPDFQPMSVNKVLKQNNISLTDSGEIGRTIFPFEYDTDGFYLAIFVKKQS